MTRPALFGHGSQLQELLTGTGAAMVAGAGAFSMRYTTMVVTAATNAVAPA